MKSLSFAAATATLLGLMAAACTVHQSEAPGLTGPSEFALSLTMNALPDAISQDGGSQSSVRILAKGPDGQPIRALTMRVDMEVNGVLQDFGSLSARTIVTGSDGVATVVYTAPAQSLLRFAARPLRDDHRHADGNELRRLEFADRRDPARPARRHSSAGQRPDRQFHLLASTCDGESAAAVRCLEQSARQRIERDRQLRLVVR
jgi:hypothetical protein